MLSASVEGKSLYSHSEWTLLKIRLKREEGKDVLFMYLGCQLMFQTVTLKGYSCLAEHNDDI